MCFWIIICWLVWSYLWAIRYGRLLLARDGKCLYFIFVSFLLERTDEQALVLFLIWLCSPLWVTIVFCLRICVIFGKLLNWFIGVGIIKPKDKLNEQAITSETQ